MVDDTTSTGSRISSTRNQDFRNSTFFKFSPIPGFYDMGYSLVDDKTSAGTLPPGCQNSKNFEIQFFSTFIVFWLVDHGQFNGGCQKSVGSRNFGIHHHGLFDCSYHGPCYTNGRYTTLQTYFTQIKSLNTNPANAGETRRRRRRKASVKQKSHKKSKFFKFRLPGGRVPASGRMFCHPPTNSPCRNIG